MYQCILCIQELNLLLSKPSSSFDTNSFLNPYCLCELPVLHIDAFGIVGAGLAKANLRALFFILLEPDKGSQLRQKMLRPEELPQNIAKHNFK